MSSSRLNKEDDDWLYLSIWVHNDPEEYPEWFDEKKYPRELLDWTEKVAYEVRFDYKVNKHTYEVKILGTSWLG